MPSEREKMQAGDWYTCLDPELEALRAVARRAVHAHNTTPPDDRGTIGGLLRDLIHAPNSAMIEAPFHCAYGFNIRLGEEVFLNAGCTILDCAPVTIGDRCALGPNVQIYCADHHRDPIKRCDDGLEVALPVTLGSRVWIGGGALLLPGITVGDGAIVGAGSIVTRDVPAGATVAGNPARLIPARG